MKVAQLIATIPDALPAEYAAELAQLQANAPPMGRPFVRRRMAAELGPDWQRTVRRASSWRPRPRPRSARCTARSLHDGRSARLQAAISRTWRRRSRPTCAQLRLIFGLYGRYDRAIDTEPDLRGDRRRGCARSWTTSARPGTSASTREMLRRRAARPRARGGAGAVDPAAADHELARGRAAARASRRRRRRSATGSRCNMFRAWYVPFYGYGVIHGDPHLGNYTVRADLEHQPARLRLHPRLPAELRARA